MTVVLGIRSKEGICLVCDSRTTDPSGIIRDDAKKLTAIYFNDGNSALVGRAGHEDLSARAVEIMVGKARNKALLDYRSGAEVAEQAVAELKQLIRQQFVGSGTELQKHFSDYSFELAIAYYWNYAPYIFTLDFALGATALKQRDYVSVGVGGILADFLMNNLNVREFQLQHAIWTGIYVVEAIKEFDGRCGGPTKFAMVLPVGAKSHVGFGLPLWLEHNVPKVRKFARKERDLWKQKVERAIKRELLKESRKFWDELKKDNYVVGEDEHGEPVRVNPKMPK